MDNNITPVENKKPKKNLAVLIVLLAIVLLAIVIYNFNKKTQTPADVNEPVANVNEVKEVSTDGFPETFYSYVGTVQKLEDNKIEILASAAKNYLSEDKTITILTSEETTFLAQDKNVDINEIQPGESGDFYKTTNISFGALKIGDEITAIDHENVKGKTEFTAKRVEVNMAEVDTTE